MNLSCSEIAFYPSNNHFNFFSHSTNNELIKKYNPTFELGVLTSKVGHPMFEVGNPRQKVERLCWSMIPTPITDGRYLLAILIDKIIPLPKSAPAWISWILFISLILVANLIDIMTFFDK